MIISIPVYKQILISGVRPRRVHHPRGELVRRDRGDRLPQRAAGAARGQALPAGGKIPESRRESLAPNSN